MSKFTERYNKGVSYAKSVPDNAMYYKLADLKEQTVYPVDALYINTKSKFGESGVILSGDKLVNLPQHLTPTVKEMRSDEELTDDINMGSFGFMVYKYSSRNGSGYSVNWCDIKPQQGDPIEIKNTDLPF